MNLNLGLESLNHVNGATVVPFTPASAIEMQNASEVINNLMTSLENYYDAARNAMLVKKAVRKYGKTQSIIALIGQEGLAAAQSFSMEGFWQKTKDFLWKIWSKIKEWWGKFWGLFFSIEDRLRTFKASLSGKVLVQDCEFNAPKLGTSASEEGSVLKAAANIDTVKGAIQTASNNSSFGISDLKTLEKWMPDSSQAANERVTAHGGFPEVHFKYTKITDIDADVTKLIKIFEDNRNTKKDVDRYTDNMLRKIKDIKLNNTTDTGSSGDIFGRGSRAAVTGTDTRDMTASENDTAIKIIKAAAKLNNIWLSATLKAATTIGVKMMANTRTKNRA